MKRFVLVAAAISAVVASPVLADMSASVTLSNLKVTLFDLDPADGVTPSVVWTPGSSDSVGVTAWDWTGAYRAFYDQGSGPWSSISRSVTAGSSQASASIASGNGADPTGGVQLAASGSAEVGRTGDVVQPGYFQASARVPYRTGFVLSPNTVAVFTVDATGSARTTVDYEPGDRARELATANARLFVTNYSRGGDIADFQDSLDLAVVSVSYETKLTYNPSTGRNETTYIGQSKSFSDLLSGAYLNHGNAAEAGYLELTAYVEGRGYGTLVPEPETYALMLAGLGMIGFISRGRWRRG